MKSLVTINWDGLTLKNNSGETTLFADRDGNLSITGTLQSARFASGILGYGWQIRNDGTAEFQDVHVRGTISASVKEALTNEKINYYRKLIQQPMPNTQIPK